jgi:hypothetical protein
LDIFQKHQEKEMEKRQQTYWWTPTVRPPNFCPITDSTSSLPFPQLLAGASGRKVYCWI